MATTILSAIRFTTGRALITRYRYLSTTRRSLPFLEIWHGHLMISLPRRTTEESVSPQGIASSMAQIRKAPHPVTYIHPDCNSHSYDQQQALQPRQPLRLRPRRPPPLHQVQRRRLRLPQQLQLFRRLPPQQIIRQQQQQQPRLLPQLQRRQPLPLFQHLVWWRVWIR